MVVDDADDGGLSRLFHALSDPTRRDVLRRCAHGDLSVSRLAAEYPMSFAAVQKHVTVLERAGLVSKQRRGREQLVRTEPDALARARRALDELEALWRGRVERMSALLTQESPTPRPPARGPRHAEEHVEEHTQEQDPRKGPEQ
ncbi:metalloregulator ArsR/SmtB family transcription factor [Streptomyces bobili]|uniref:ArsR/SmtB family transcription factor n=1 Tax=Streptomyces bobili TaxID=67280 RepID=UPI0033C4A4F5